jgi:hypothetical protein
MAFEIETEIDIAAPARASCTASAFFGFLVPWLQKSLDRDTRQGFMAMNRAMRQRLEK